MKRPELGTRDGPGPGPGNIPFKALGKQRINSAYSSAAEFGFGSGTREQMDLVDLSRYHVANLSSRALLGGPIDYSRAADNREHDAEHGMLMTANATAIKGPSKAALSRALAIALSARPGGDDQKLDSALFSLHRRVEVLRANCGQNP